MERKADILLSAAVFFTILGRKFNKPDHYFLGDKANDKRFAATISFWFRYRGRAGTALARGINASPVARASKALEDRGSISTEDLSRDETFWANIRRGFDLPPSIINLDNGYCNPLSRLTANDLVSRARYIEQLPAKRLDELYSNVTGKLVRPGVARVLGVPANEISLVRNTTEALDTVILGLPMKSGDEIVCSAHDYYAMLDAIEQRQKRDGIVIKMIRPPLPAPSLKILAEHYEASITSKTKLVLVTHASNMSGQLFPVKRIAAAAHRVGAEVAVDGAQTMALLNYKIADLDCDYFGASLHKWLMAPIGMGVLWMRPQHVSKVWPLIPPSPGVAGMMRFEWCGTFPEFISSAAAPAIAFHEKLGAAQKETRIRYLGKYWREKIEKLPGVRFYTTDSSDSTCGLGILEIEGIDLAKLQDHLWRRHKILVQYMNGGPRAPELRGIRVTPNIYTSLPELDKFVNVIAGIAKRGLASAFLQ